MEHRVGIILSRCSQGSGSKSEGFRLMLLGSLSETREEVKL